LRPLQANTAGIHCSFFGMAVRSRLDFEDAFVRSAVGYTKDVGMRRSRKAGNDGKRKGSNNYVSHVSAPSMDVERKILEVARFSKE
jgi:hypothetical protein